MSDQQRYEFQTEARQLLELMIHSVYSHKEIFLRELISNASDALDKLRFEALQKPELSSLTGDLHIRLVADPERRTLSIVDNGIGMSRDEVIRYIGTIARSGTQEYLRRVREAADDKGRSLSAELIGQFGVGFYSCFMVADRVVLTTRRAGEEAAWRWVSTGDGSYTLEEASRGEPGTTVELHLKKAEPDDALDDFASEDVLRDVVRRYSDFVAYPIRMRVEKTIDPGKPEEGVLPKTTTEDATLNSMKALWMRPESEVKDEEYKDFYKHLAHDWADPLDRIVLRAEGVSEFRALLFIPARAPFDLFMPDAHHGLQLYIKRVFIMGDCKPLVPTWLRFLRGVVDSEDLSLNLSREMLQKDRQVQVIRKAITRKLLDALKAMREGKPETYRAFWKEYGKVLKEGLLQDAAHRDALLDLCLFSTTAGKEPTTLADYLGRMKEGQEGIYYLTGRGRDDLAAAPHVEAFRARGYEVLLLNDPVDEMWIEVATRFRDKPLVSVGKGDVAPGTEEERKQAEAERREKTAAARSLLDRLQRELDEHVKEVRFSGRLTTSAACLVSDEADMAPHLEQFLRSMGREVPLSKRTLELNPGHPVVARLQALFDKDPADPRVAEAAHLLHGLALLAEGSPLPSPADFSRRISEILTRSLA